MASITLQNITKIFGKTKVIDDLSIKIKDKEFLTILGPSGCGKTTTLRIIAGLETPTSGDILFDDKSVLNLQPSERNVAMVFQKYTLYPHMSIFDNIAFPLKIRKIPKEEIKKEVIKMAEFLHIEQLLDRKPNQISGGEQQRVAIARALVRKPRVFLLDEPLANLDAKLRIYMRAELKKLHEKVKITTVYVTHDQAEALAMSDRIATMKDGKIQQLSSPEELFLRPQNLWVADFLENPPMNFLDCVIEKKKDKRFLSTKYFALPISKSLSDLISKNAKGSELVLAVRATDLKIDKKKIPDSFKAKVYVTELLGQNTNVVLKTDDGMLKAILIGYPDIKVGEEVYCKIDPQTIHIYDKKTTQLLY